MFLLDAVLTVEPNWSSLFIGESVTLTCDIKEGKDTDWEYRWKKDEVFVQYISNKYYNFKPILVKDSGRYQCSGFHRSLKNSNIISLTVSAKLTAGPTIIPVGGRVTLSCSVDDSDGWKYDWFRRTSNSNEAQVDGEENKDIRVSQGGIYRCRGRRGKPVYYTDYSDEVTVEITGEFSSCVSNISTHLSGHFTTIKLIELIQYFYLCLSSCSNISMFVFTLT
uniref:Ig-like domain-containing protein n=1 Tax=Anabas testudineus TaxID=64144 RepID=A0A3Q1IN04_ANATE